MSKVVFKYPLNIDSQNQAIEMPFDSRVVHVGLQDGKPRLWAEHNWPDEYCRNHKRYFDVFGTGQSIPSEAIHISTFFDGPFVWHVYEVT